MKDFLTYFQNSDQRHYTIAEIKSRLEQYAELYVHISLQFDGMEPLKVGFQVYCAFMESMKEEEDFKKRYHFLKDFIRIAESEEYFKDELTYYHQNKEDLAKIKEQVIKNHDLCQHLICAFLVNYEDNEGEKQLKYWEIRLDEYYNLDNFRFRVSKNEFTNTLVYLDLFYDLFWNKEVWPEAIEKINLELEKAGNEYEKRESKKEFGMEEEPVKEMPYQNQDISSNEDDIPF